MRNRDAQDWCSGQPNSGPNPALVIGGVTYHSFGHLCCTADAVQTGNCTDIRQAVCGLPTAGFTRDVDGQPITMAGGVVAGVFSACMAASLRPGPGRVIPPSAQGAAGIQFCSWFAKVGCRGLRSYIAAYQRSSMPNPTNANKAWIEYLLTLELALCNGQ